MSDNNLETDKIERIRIQSDFFQNRTVKGNKESPGRIVFKYEGQLHGFGTKLTDEEAKDVFDKVKYYLPSTALKT